MSFNGRTIKLGRLFMVAWLTFFIYPIDVILTSPFPFRSKALALAVLLASGAVWAWFWLRVCDGPDSRFAWAALALTAILLSWFTAMTPPQYGTMMVCVTVMAGAAFGSRLGVPLVAISALGAGVLDVGRGTHLLQAVGEVLNDGIVGFAAVAGRLLIEANRQLSLAREQIARLAVGEERLRFARDLHDLLGHSLSVIALKSELAGRLIKRSPGLAEHEVQDIEKVARDALREVREAVAGYRQPTLAAELAGAREAMTAAGIEMRINEEHDGLPPTVEPVLAWAIREGATNVLRHSNARRCGIRIATEDGQAIAEVTDDGRGGEVNPGSGLTGLRERVEQRAGALTAEPLPREGFRLRVSVPLQNPLPDPPPNGEGAHRETMSSARD
jgi:two-component system sensor histidine kinase DesK